ncbi:hypothetical protein EP7_000129 [Isosphaeraceae bacterium EP7]
MAENCDSSADAREQAVAIRRMRARRSRTMALGLIVGVVWMGLWLDPLARPLLVCVLLAVGSSLAILLAAMALGGLGLLGLKAFDLTIARVRRAGRWPEK